MTPELAFIAKNLKSFVKGEDSRTFTLPMASGIVFYSEYSTEELFIALTPNASERSPMMVLTDITDRLNFGVCLPLSALHAINMTTVMEKQTNSPNVDFATMEIDELLD